MAKAKKPATTKPAPKQPAPKQSPPKAKRARAGDASSLLAQILATPDDRALRLVYADQLIDAGDPRGTFISQQCTLEELDPLDERYAPMLASTHRLLATHGSVWIGGYDKRAKLAMIGRDPAGPLANAVFRGGFLERIAMAPEDIAKEWPRLRASEPIQGVELTVSEQLDEAYRKLTEPREFRVLKVTPSSWFTGNSAGNVLAWGMPDLYSLDLSGCDLGTDGARILANQPTDLATVFDDYVDPPPFAPGQLRELILDSTNLGDDGARLVFAAAHLSSLEALDLKGCRLTDSSTLEALRDAPAMRALVRLSLAGNNELGPHLGMLANWPVIPRLVALKLPQTTTPAALRALFPKPSAALRTLELPSAKALAAAPNIAEVAEALVELDLGTTSLGDDRFSELLAAPSVRRLLHLHVNGCSLSDAAIARLVASPLDRLVTLDLSSNKLTDAGLQMLAGWDGLQHVTHQRIGNNRKVTVAGIESLAGVAAAARLQPALLDVGKPADRKLAERLRDQFGDVVVASG
ncbi:MAG: TIGR02996 domain-containing protein [Deltaproteobacteria bacterium]|nr:TIGR02996 domain-containing protein [Deltaproteobacteria bacterium]